MIRVVQIDNFRGLLGIRWVDKGIVQNDKRIDGVLHCFGHDERMKNDRIAKRAYVGECAGSR